ncbi:MAG: DUF418 domain-containing protein [Mariniblastus sp.]|nr:DUF418 domain-containing protein [Mariniblastus sp.]
MNPPAELNPTPASQRILSLDLLRGVAVLGILAMNIQSFSMIDAAYLNPASFGDFTGVNGWVWYITHLVADTKFITIFSILFGAGVVLMADRARAQGRSAASLHYRRMFWLLLFGLVHAYLLWYGDILVTYAICGICIYPLHRLRNRWLIPLALLLLLIPSLLIMGLGATVPFWPAEEVAAFRADSLPDEGEIERQLQIYRGGWLDQVEHRAVNAIFMQTFLLLILNFWRASGLMLLGMVFLRWGVLQARSSVGFYLLMVVVGCAVGLPLIAHGVAGAMEHEWDPIYVMFKGMQFNYWGSLFVAAAWIGAVMIVSKVGWVPLQPLVAALAATGRMAFTNYLAQTVIACLIFYGYGLGYHGYLERWEQMVVVLGIWLLQLIGSQWWLAHFRYGPMEWLWRSLVLWKRQPMRKTGSSLSLG